MGLWRGFDEVAFAALERGVHHQGLLETARLASLATFEQSLLDLQNHIPHAVLI